MTPPTPPPMNGYRLARIALWIFGGGVFAVVLLLSAYMGLTFSDEAWKSITSISLAVIAAGVPLIISKINKVEKHTNSIVEKLVDQAEVKGEETGRKREVARKDQEEEDKEGALTAKDEADQAETKEADEP